LSTKNGFMAILISLSYGPCEIRRRRGRGMV
jgi:hypothetical protein